jgi:hypothetical protein
MGLLDNALQAIKNQYQETKGNVGLLMSDPKQYMSGLNQDAAEYNRLSSLALQAERNAYRGIPVSQEQAAAKQYIDQQQQDMALGFAGTVTKNPTPFNVSHGTNATFSEFMPNMGVTAKHIYTAPENYAADAALYGKNVINAVASPKKMIDFSDFDKLDKTTLSSMKKAAKDAGITDKYYNFNNFLDDVMSGNLYQSGGGSRTQDAFLSELFSKYDAVKMPDAAIGGGLSKSVVFENPKLLAIQKK